MNGKNEVAFKQLPSAVHIPASRLISTIFSPSILTVVCTKVPKPTSNSLKLKQLVDVNKQSSICDIIGVVVKSINLTRITCLVNSQHYGVPRLFRVVLTFTYEAEAVMLSIARIRNG